MVNDETLYSSTDTDNEVALVIELSKAAGAFDAKECSHWADGGKKSTASFWLYRPKLQHLLPML